MMRKKRTVAMTAIAISVALGATACGGSSTKSSPSGSTGTRISGGTLVYYAPSDFDEIDPQRTYTTQGMNIDQEMVRTLTGWSQSPGSGAPKLVGDLATDTGTASNNDRTWTFHIRPGVKWQDGSTVTSYDVKYGVERAASPDITSGTTYWQWLVGASSYKGPYQGKSLPSIETPNASTIIFQLSSSQAEFPEAAAMDTFAAVPKAKDTGANYNSDLQSDGPYEIKSYTQGKELILVKNPYWSAATDPMRQQNVAEIDIKMGEDMASIDQLMKADQGQAQDAVIEDPIAGTDLTPFTMDPALKSRMHNIATPGVDYIAMNTTTITNVKVREAIGDAINKETYRGAMGGSAYGDIATSFLPTGTPGRIAYNPYDNTGTGNVTAAKALMAQAGVKTLTLSLAVKDTPTMEKAADSIKDSLSQIGITVNIKPIDSGTYFNNIGNKSNNYDLIWSDWFADWPSAQTIDPILLDGRQIQAQGNNDYSLLNDKKAEAMMDAAAALTDPTAQANAYAAADKYIFTTDYPLVPLTYRNQTEMSGSNVGGLTEDTIIGELDLTHVYLTK